MPNPIDITGQRYGRLVALSRAGHIRFGKQRKTTWLFRCDCGSEVVRKLMNVRKGDTKSCGCQKAESSAASGARSRLTKGESSFKALFDNYARRAKRLGKPFEITQSEFRELTGGNCFYCGTEPSQTKTAHKQSYGEYRYNGLDRVVNELGYLKSNVVPCCGICNRAKSVMGREQFLSWARRVAARDP